jgi:hypothetical protein
VQHSAKCSKIPHLEIGNSFSSVSLGFKKDVLTTTEKANISASDYVIILATYHTN